MDLYEYQGKELFRRFGIPVSDGRLATTPTEARAAELLGGAPGLFRGVRETPLGDGDAEPPKELLALVLVEVHSSRAGSLAARSAPEPRGTTRRDRHAFVTEP